MLNKTYTDIVIRGNEFFIMEDKLKLPRGKSTALSELERIEHITREGLSYSTDRDDQFSRLSESALYAELLERALQIRDGYLQKASRLSFIWRFLGGVSKTENMVKAAYGRIAAPERVPIRRLPPELLQHTLSFLPTREMDKFCKVIEHGQDHVEQAEIDRAREFGYKGRDPAEAKQYLQAQIQSVQILLQAGLMPEEVIARKGWRPFFRKADTEETLRNIKNLPEERNRIFAEKLTILLKNYCMDLHPYDFEYYALKVMHACYKLEVGINIDAKIRRCTALILAASQGNENKARSLLKLGANPNIQIFNGSTALSELRNRNITELLLEHGADPNLQSNILYTASTNVKPEHVELLLKYGANPNLQDGMRGDTALGSLFGHDHDNWSWTEQADVRDRRKKETEYRVRKTAELLLKFGANPNIQDFNGKTPLMKAALVWHNMHRISIELLILNGANLDMRDHTGRTALQLAAERGNTGMVDLLKWFGAELD